jgi:hypothetical protein
MGAEGKRVSVETGDARVGRACEINPLIGGAAKKLRPKTVSG